MQGKTINGFTLQRLLGAGGMAEVWYAENEISMKAAVKIMSDELSRNAHMRDRFLNEAKVMVMLDHPNIRKVYGYGSIDDRPSIIMEYLDGSDLKARMKNGQSFTQYELAKWWNQLADALNYTHARDVVHRDIKPSNIFIDQHGNAKLLDFGIAKVTDTTSGTLTGTTLGTRIYMSPEQVRDPKRVGTASDVYSLAVSFVHLLSGKAPYDSTTSSDFDIQLSIVTKPLDMSLIPVDWQSFLTPYLAKEPDDRPALCHIAEGSEITQSIQAQSHVENENQSLLEENRLLKEKYRELERMMAEQKAKEGNNALDAMDAEDATVAENNADVGASEAELAFNVNDVSFVMKRVEGGTFWMGAHVTYKKSGLFSKIPESSIPNFDKDANSDEQPVHTVTLGSFYMCETVVTQELWKAVMGNNPSHFKGNNRPVDNVSYNDIVNVFLPKLNQMTGKNFRLPTEAEWEYAARGGNCNNGYKYAGSNYLDTVAWFEETTEEEGTKPVKLKTPNELGLYDMSGNVWEWCHDWYDSSYYSNSPSNNPQGPSKGSYRVMRGGCWGSYEKYCRVSSRSYFDMESSYDRNGFRLCLSQ